MIDKLYVPILKTKRAEFNAIGQLTPDVKSKVIPLLEIEPVPIDPETGTPDKTYDIHLRDMGEKISNISSNLSSVYIDGILIEEQFIDQYDAYPLTNVITQARTAGVHVVPVSSPTRSKKYQFEIKKLVEEEVCLRLTTADLANPQMIADYISSLNISYNCIDIIIDLRDSITEDSLESGQSTLLALGLINNLRNLTYYRRIILASGAFPVDLSQISVGVQTLPRLGWLLWNDITKNTETARSVIYSDYGIQHPAYSRLATRFPSISASIRYTADEDYLVFRGKKANVYGYEQYGAHSKLLVSRPEYSGSDFSAADAEILEYSKKYEKYLEDKSSSHKFGSPEVWRKIGQSHHITKVVDQISSLYEL